MIVKRTSNRLVQSWFLCLLALALMGAGTAAYGVTADGDISDIRAFSSPSAPAPIELADPLGFTDEPILSSQIVNQPCSPNCISPTGFNIGSVVMAYDPANDSYYIGVDVSPSPADDPTFGNGSGAWDSDGDGDPNLLTDGLTMSPPILYDQVPPLSGLTDKYTCSLDIGNDGLNDLLLIVEDVGFGPALTIVGPPCLTGSAGWSVGDYVGNGPDAEFIVGNVSCLGKPECDYYKVRATTFADTDADSAEEIVALVFEFDIPLTLCKVDETGAGIADWTFTVNGESVTTGPDGCVTLFMPPDSGPWEICEIMPAGQHTCGIRVDDVAVTPEETSPGVWCITVDADCHEVTWCNEVCLADIQVCKVGCLGLLPPEDRAGWVIDLTGPVSRTLTTDAEGCVIFTDLPIGTYTVTETLKPGWEYCPGETGTRTVEITCEDHGTTVALSAFSNQRCLRDIQVCKEGCTGPLDPADRAGWVIDLAGPVSMTLTTDDTGCVTFRTLPVGVYTITETLKPGWEYCPGETGVRTIEISCDSVPTQVVTFRNTPCVGSITACKYDCDGNPLPGWEITLDGPVTATEVTDETGCVTFTDLPVGDYVVCETLPPGWKLCDGSQRCYGVPITCEEPDVRVSFRNERCLASIEVCKTDCAGARLPGWEITLDGPVTATEVTDDSGCVRFSNLPVGVYTITETLWPGWKYCDGETGSRTVELTCDDHGTVVSVAPFRNERCLADIEVCKVDCAGNRLPGWDVTLAGPGGILLTQTTDETGCVVFSNLPVGVYTVTEELLPGWKYCEGETGSRTVTLTCDDHGTVVLVDPFRNERCLASIRACKTDCDGRPLAGWVIELSGPVGTSAVTDDTGCVVFSNLPVGVYTVTEALLPGWKYCDGETGSRTVTLTCADHGTVVGLDPFRNERCLASIEVCKVDCAGNMLPGWDITLTHPDGNTETRTTDASGCVTFAGLPVGTYTVCETLLPGWKYCDGETGCRTVTLTCNDHGTVVSLPPFQNERCLASIEMCKVDCAGSMLPGWDITLTYPDGTTETRTTDASGCVLFSNLPVGVYTLTETLLPGWKYCPGETGSRTVELTCDDHGTVVSPLWFQNERCLADIQVCKIDCRTGESLPGWEITLTHPDGSTETQLTDGNGCAYFPNLPVGDYTITETLQPGWEYCEGETGSRTVTLTCDNHGQRVVLEPFRNQPCLGTITACKSVCGGVPRVANWTITVTDDAGNVIADGTGPDGCAYFDGLPVGTYTVCEEMRPGWELCPGYSLCYTVEISCDQKEVSVDFRNQPCLGTIEACKQDCDGNPLSGWEIVLNTALGEVVATATTDDSGCVTFTQVPVGDYVVCETMQAGWELCPGFELCYPVSISCDLRDVDVLFSDQPCMGTITACKYECEGLPVADMEIVLTGDTVIGPISRALMTGPDGCVTFTDLPAGTYQVCETLRAGWELCDEIQWPLCQTVVISCDVRQAYVEFRNYPTVGPTRTPGYWFTHPDAMELALDEDCGGYIAGGEFLLDCCMFDIYDANRVFWLGNQELDPNVRRTLGMHIIAAMCNVCLLGSAPPDGFIEYGISVFCDPTATAEQIGDAIEPLDVFNNSGTTLDVDFLEGLSADPNRAKGMARMGDLSCVPTL